MHDSLRDEALLRQSRRRLLVQQVVLRVHRLECVLAVVEEHAVLRPQHRPLDGLALEARVVQAEQRADGGRRLHVIDVHRRGLAVHAQADKRVPVEVGEGLVVEVTQLELALAVTLDGEDALLVGERDHVARLEALSRLDLLAVPLLVLVPHVDVAVRPEDDRRPNTSLRRRPGVQVAKNGGDAAHARRRVPPDRPRLLVRLGHLVVDAQPTLALCPTRERPPLLGERDLLGHLHDIGLGPLAAAVLVLDNTIVGHCGARGGRAAHRRLVRLRIVVAVLLLVLVLVDVIL